MKSRHYEHFAKFIVGSKYNRLQLVILDNYFNESADPVTFRILKSSFLNRHALVLTFYPIGESGSLFILFFVSRPNLSSCVLFSSFAKAMQLKDINSFFITLLSFLASKVLTETYNHLTGVLRLLGFTLFLVSLF